MRYKSVRPMGFLRLELLRRAALGGEWTVSGLAESVRRSSDLCRPHVVQLEKFGWLRKIRESHNAGGGKKIGVYVWTGQPLPDDLRAPALEAECASLVVRCMTAMVTCGRSA